MVGLGIGVGRCSEWNGIELSSAGSARSFYCLDGCARPLTRGWGGGGARLSAESGYCRPEETRVPGRIRWTRLR
jgi:hypothetical protein